MIENLTTQPGANIVLNVMKLAWKYDCGDSFFVRYDDRDYMYSNKLFVKQGFHVYAICNDWFMWACADAEEVTEENFDVLVKAFEDLKPVDDSSIYGAELFACRVREMRPMKAVFKDWTTPTAQLFLDAGPERDPKTEG